MPEADQEIVVDLSNLYAIAGGDDTFVMALLGKMCKALPEAYENMQKAVGEKDWPTLKSTAHKAKSTFAYLSLIDMRDRLKDIEHNCIDLAHLEEMPRLVDEAVVIGEKVLAVLKVELAKLM